MEYLEKKKKLGSLPWQALLDAGVKYSIPSADLKSKSKDDLITKILSYKVLSDEEIEQLISDYIYGDRITFTLWTFKTSLDAEAYKKLLQLKDKKYSEIGVTNFRNMMISKIDEHEDRYEVLYTYSKEYFYINEEGKRTSVWEQHRGCLWVGKIQNYLACISKHESMTEFITHFVARQVENTITQIKPPKAAIERCTNNGTISRIVLQGADGEKTIVSRSDGLTIAQENEVSSIRNERLDTSGSYIADIEDTSTRIKYNIQRGSIGVYKHLPSQVLFRWSQAAIKIIFEEIDKLKGKPVEDIFKEMGLELKWPALDPNEKIQMNWFLTQVISSLDKNDERTIQIPDEYKGILSNSRFFIEIPRIYCEECEGFEPAYCAVCKRQISLDKNGKFTCACGNTTQVTCAEGHRNCRIAYWYIPTPQTKACFDRNICQVFKTADLSYRMCIMSDTFAINSSNFGGEDVEVRFEDIDCFQKEYPHLSDDLQYFTVKLREKCNCTCSYSKIRKCINDNTMCCIPKVFYGILPEFQLQPHSGIEYGDISAQVKAGGISYEMKGILKSNSHKSATVDTMLEKVLLTTSSAGQEIIRQFVQQGMVDTRCTLIAIAVPEKFDQSLKGTIRYLARLAKKKVVFIELAEMCKLVSVNEFIKIPQ